MIIFSSFIVLCILLLIGISVPLAFGGIMVLLATFGDFDVTGYLPSGHWKMNSLVLLAIPLFIIAGAVMERGRIAEPLVNLAELMIGHIRGGLSVATVVASGIFGSISGSGSATLNCIGSVMMPHLRKAQYPAGLSAALITNASPLGMLIPPSSSHILYAWVSQQSVLKCFMSTLLPGIILIILLCVVNQFQLRKYKNLKLSGKPKDFKFQFKKRSKKAFPALLMPVFILGGIYGGVMTPTEAAGFAVIYAIPVAIYIYKGMTWDTFRSTMFKAGVTVGVVMSMIFMVLIVSRFLMFEDIPGIAEDFVYSASDNPIVILLMVNLALILIGMLMDDISGLLLSTPILLPIVVSAGMDPIHFAAVLGVNLGMANVTPPTAPNLYLGARITETPVVEMLKPTMMFILFAWLPTLMLTTFIPQLSLFLPELLLG